MEAIHQFTAQSQALELYRAMSDFDRHKFLQLAIAELEIAETEGDLFLSAAATELYPDNETAQDNLYPFGKQTPEGARRHKAEMERDVIRAERYANGRLAMMFGRTEPMPGLERAWRGGL